MANKIGVTRSALSQYELGLRQPDYDIVKKMADYFNVSTDYLLGRETNENTSIEETEEDHLRAIAFDKLKSIKDINELQKAVDHLEYLESKIKK